MVFRYVLEELTETELLDLDQRRPDRELLGHPLRGRRRRRPAARRGQRGGPPDPRRRTRHRGGARDRRARRRPWLTATSRDRDHELVTPQLLRGWRLPVADRRQGVPRPDPDRRAAAPRCPGRCCWPRRRRCAPAPASSRWRRRPASPASCPSRSPRRWSAASRRRRAARWPRDGVDRLEELAQGASAVLVGPGHDRRRGGAAPHRPAAAPPGAARWCSTPSASPA